MIAHVILFQPKPELSSSDRRPILEALAAAAAEIPSIQGLRVGRRTRHGLPGYEQAMREDYEYLVIVEFADIGALKAYLQHPAHLAIGRHFGESSSAALAYDYELVAASDAPSLLADRTAVESNRAQ